VWGGKLIQRNEPAERDILIYDVQRVNLILLMTFDFGVMRNIFFTWLLPLILTYMQIYIFKRFQTQASRHAQSNVYPKVTLTLRIWFSLMLSQVAVLGIVVMIVWNYNPKFYIIL